MIYSIHTSGVEETFPLRLQFFGINHHQSYINRPDGVTYYQWFYCVKGEGELHLGEQHFHIKKGQGFLIHPNAPHIYYGTTPNWTLNFFGFSGPLCPELLRLLQMQTSGSYHFSDSTIFSKHLESLLWLYETRFLERSYSYSKECYDFLLDVSRCISRAITTTSTQENKRVATIISYLERNYASPITLQELSDKVYLSKDYMSAIFKKETGRTIMQYLTDIRLGHAQHLLLSHTDKRIVDIGKMCGFDSPSYFGKQFKKSIGTTPEKYRRNL